VEDVLEVAENFKEIDKNLKVNSK